MVLDADVPGGRQADGHEADDHRARDDRDQGPRSGCRQRLEALHPAQGGEPDESVEPGARVGDHPQGVAGAEDRAGVPGRPAAGGAELAAQRPDGREHQRAGHQGDGEEQAGPGRDGDPGRPAGDHDDRRRSRPTARRRPPPGRTAAWAVARPRVVAPVEEELPPAGVLLAAQQPGAGQQSPDGPDDAEGEERLEHGEPGDRSAAWGAGPKRAMVARFEPKAAARASRWRRVR